MRSFSESLFLPFTKYFRFRCFIFCLLVGASSWAHTSLLSWHELRLWGDCGTFWSDLNVLRGFDQISMFLFWGDLHVFVSFYHFHFSSVEKTKCICIYLALLLFSFWDDLIVLLIFWSLFLLFEWPRYLSVLCHFHFSCFEVSLMWVSFQEPESPKPVLPTCLAVPWSNISERLGLPPIIVHATISLSNWRKIDPEGPFSLSNLTTIFSLDSTRCLKDH